jgi:hypothetical protein
MTSPIAEGTVTNAENLSNIKIISRALNAKFLVDSNFLGTTFGLAIPVNQKDNY